MKRNATKIELVVCDMDNTLVQKETAFSAETLEMISRLEQSEVRFAIATGRMPHKVDPFLASLGNTTPYIACNGAVIKQGDEILQCRTFTCAKLKPLILHYLDKGATVILSLGEEERPLTITPWVKQRLHKYQGYNRPLGTGEEVWGLATTKLYILEEERTGIIDTCAAELEQMQANYSISQYGSFSIELVTADCSKATGLRWLLQRLGINASNVLAIGDHTNDIALIEMVGVGAAVANADNALLSRADYVCKNSFSTGVLEAVERFVFSGAP